jgi:hypothetical protein
MKVRMLLSILGVLAQSVLNCAHEKEIIQAEDERERAAHEDVLQRSAPAVEIQAVHLHSLHARARRQLHH